MIPVNAPAVIAMVAALLPFNWPDHPAPELLVAQAEQESCFSLTHKKCLDPRIENINPKNNNEHGFGVFQLTKTDRFDNFSAARSLSPELKNWKWEDRFDLRKQVIAGILMDKGLYRSCSRLMATARDSYACALSGYNGGAGAFNADRRLCSNTQGCNARVWFGNVEVTSVRPKTPLKGYRVSAYQINREYVHNIMNVRSKRYAPYFKDKDK